MPTIGEWIRGELETAGDKGVVAADLFTELRTTHDVIGVIYKGGTYNSFARFFFWLKQLKYVEKTGETEVSLQRGKITNQEYAPGAYPLKAPRTYYCLTDEGKVSLIEDWCNPLAAVHPEWAPSGWRRQELIKRWKREKKIITRPRGRPRVAAPGVVLPPVLPPPPPEVVLPTKLEAIQTKASKLYEAMRALKEHPKKIGYIESELHDIHKATGEMMVPKNLREKVDGMHRAALKAYDTIEAVKTSLAMIADLTVTGAKKRGREEFIDEWASEFCKEVESFMAIPKLPPDVAEDVDLISDIVKKWGKRKPNVRLLEALGAELGNLKVTDISEVKGAIEVYRKKKTSPAWEDVILAMGDLDPGDLL